MDETQISATISTVSVMITEKPPTPSPEEIKSLLFHLETGDFFKTMITILGFLEETVKGAKKDIDMEKVQANTIQLLKKELSYLNDNYHIVPKEDTATEK